MLACTSRISDENILCGSIFTYYVNWEIFHETMWIRCLPRQTFKIKIWLSWFTSVISMLHWIAWICLSSLVCSSTFHPNLLYLVCFMFVHYFFSHKACSTQLLRLHFSEQYLTTEELFRDLVLLHQSVPILFRLLPSFYACTPLHF